MQTMQQTKVLVAVAILLTIVPGTHGGFLEKQRPSMAALGLDKDARADHMELLEVSSSRMRLNQAPLKSRMPMVDHNKSAGGGYEKGSPLYDKQQKQNSTGNVTSGPTDSWNYFSKIFSPFKIFDNVHKDVDTVYKDPTAMADTSNWTTYLAAWSIGFVSHLAMVMLIGLVFVKCIGRHTPYPEKTISQGADGFSYGIFSVDCSGVNPMICFCSWCCLPIRWADTMSKEPAPAFLGFWAALFFFVLLTELNALTFNITAIVGLFFAVYYRQKLRSEYGILNCIDHGRGITLVQDCLTWSFCCCCAAVQEARQVEFVSNPKLLAMSRVQAPVSTGTMLSSSTTMPMQYPGVGMPPMSPHQQRA